MIPIIAGFVFSRVPKWDSIYNKTNLQYEQIAMHIKHSTISGFETLSM